MPRTFTPGLPDTTSTPHPHGTPSIVMQSDIQSSALLCSPITPPYHISHTLNTHIMHKFIYALLQLLFIYTFILLFNNLLCIIIAGWLLTFEFYCVRINRFYCWVTNLNNLESIQSNRELNNLHLIGEHVEHNLPEMWEGIPWDEPGRDAGDHVRDSRHDHRGKSWRGHIKDALVARRTVHQQLESFSRFEVVSFRYLNSFQICDFRQLNFYSVYKILE